MRKLAVVLLWAIPTVSALYLFLAAFGLAPNPYICLTSTVDNITHFPGSGYGIMIVETDCDAIAKWDRVSVYLYEPNENKSDPIFEYEPPEVNRLPAFSIDAEGSLLASIATVGTVFRQEHVWRGKTIACNIGKEYDPEPKPPAGQR